MNCVEELLHLFETRGPEAYFGEPVSQREHALQAAHLAVRESAHQALVAAALLHDVGHLLTLDEHAAERGVDQVHEELASAWLAKHFRPEVTEPIRLHVSAKRYLCAIEGGYLQTLSPASVLSLELQGGPFREEEIALFQANPHWRDAVRLRRWDDEAKVLGLNVPDLSDYVTLLHKLSRTD